MYLKSLKLVGFKSFADRTRLELRPGVTVVVGPNGSGKSNLVDALSWVMGSQSTRSLRTQKMEDVIFAGTATRPPLNRAEVTLIIDNATGSLPLDLPEVALTRRLYRDGSSDYEMNGVPCRLLDIQELLSDSGVGRLQHTIIGQGEINTVLNASPEEHRAVIEEAAGILKHRKRRERSIRRLERTDSDVVRLHDLMAELARQMRPLKRQATAAEAYTTLRDEVRSLTLFVAGRQLGATEAQIAGLDEERRVLVGAVEEAASVIESLSGELARLTPERARINHALAQDTAAAALVENGIERLLRVASVAGERRRATTGRLDGNAERRSDLDGELQALDDERRELASARVELDEAVSRHEARFRRLEDEERSLVTQAGLSPEGALAAVRGEIAALEAVRERDRREAESVQRRLDIVLAHSTTGAAEIDRINAEIKDLDTETAELDNRYQAAVADRERTQTQWLDAERSLSDAQLAAAAASARVEAIRAAMSRPGDSAAQRVVDTFAGALGMVADRLDVPAGLEAAVDAALGGWVGSVAFVDIEALEAAVANLKGSEAGGLSLVAASSPGAVAARQVSPADGVAALIDRLGPGADASLAARLLGDVVLVGDWTDGWRFVAGNPGLRAVTLDGDLISVVGIDIGGGATSLAVIEKAEEGLKGAETEVARSRSRHTTASRAFEGSRGREREALEALEAAEARLAGSTEAMARLQRSKTDLDDEARRLGSRVDALAESEVTREEQIRTLRRRLESLEGEEEERARLWEDLETRRLEVAAAKEVDRSAWQEAASALSASLEAQRLIDDRRNRITAELSRMSEGGEPGDDVETLVHVEDVARAAVEMLIAKLDELRSRQRDLRRQVEEMEADLATATVRHDRARRDHGDGRDRIAAIDIRLTELRMVRESAVEWLRRDADATPEEARDAPQPKIDGEPETILESKAAQLRRLGPINALAATEYAELDARHRFLAEQLADLESSRSELRKVIKALDDEISRRFEGAFHEVAEAFQRFITVLFPGGRGRLMLSDPDDLEMSGVDIQAQPLGKKVSRLSLLSGGERSLVALAFLFAVFEARPSPFYVLDEVEAALDDANLRRFIRLADEFRHKSQLVIVTHQQQTMSCADILYGVTIEPGGSSKVVAKTLNERILDEVPAI